MLIRFVLWMVLLASVSVLPAENLRFKVTEKNKVVPCRIHLKDASGKTIRAGDLPFWNDHFVCPGEVRLQVPPGVYTFEIERGPEYARNTGTVEIKEKQEVVLERQLVRLTELAKEGWWSGDLHVHRKLEEVALTMQAEDLNVAGVITWWNNANPWKDKEIPHDLLIKPERNRFYHLMGGEDEREGGALLFFHLNRPLPIQNITRESPSPLTFVEEALKQSSPWIDVEKPFWWDFPTWVADGRVHSVGIANNHMQRSRMLENEAWGRARNLEQFPNPHGNGLWTQEIYYHLLNTGFRLPPSAGSASGVLANPVGYNRVYVHLDRPFYRLRRTLKYDAWWENLKRGRSFVSNGPLLRCQADGEWPGEVFQGVPGETLVLPLQAKLDSADPIQRVEVVKDGKVIRSLTYKDWQEKGLGSVEFVTSGWFLVRAIADVPHTFRFASTAPFYVQFSHRPYRISKSSAQFFLDWVRERSARIEGLSFPDKATVLSYHKKAELYWQQRVDVANAD